MKKQRNNKKLYIDHDKVDNKLVWAVSAVFLIIVVYPFIAHWLEVEEDHPIQQTLENVVEVMTGEEVDLYDEYPEENMP